MSNTELNEVREAFESHRNPVVLEILQWNQMCSEYEPSEPYQDGAATKAEGFNAHLAGFEEGFSHRQAEIDEQHALAYAVDQGEGGEKVTYKEMLVGAENSAAAWKAALDALKTENERLKSELEKLRNE